MDEGQRRRLLLYIALGCVSLGAAGTPTPLNIKAAFFDQSISAFGGEFGARVAGNCGYSGLVPGMVQDTLPYSKSLHKKFPRRSLAECNSRNLEKWFDPAFAAAVGCRDLPFDPLPDTAGKPPGMYRFRKDLFFPIDDMPGAQIEGPGPAWDSIPGMSLPTGYQGVHNFNWCMEINAQFTYRGGEVFYLRGEDDIWIYLDNRLVGDQGGVHGPDFPSRLVMDSLPQFAGKQGQTFDLDVYFCERRPAGSALHIETNIELKPPVFRDLEITHPDGAGLDPRRPLTGKTRLCATADYAPQDVCGNVLPIPANPLYPATWTLDGMVIATDSACIELDPSQLPPNRKVPLVARAEGKSARLQLQLLRGNLPLSVVLKGRGRLETAVLRFDPRHDSLLGPVEMRFAHGGSLHSLTGAGKDFDTAGHSLAWTLQGPSGITGLESPLATVLQAIGAGDTLLFNAPLIDSISPAVRTAAWRAGPGGEYWLDVAPSESLASPLPTLLELLSFKSRAGQRFRMGVPGAGVGPGPEGMRVVIPPGAPLDPRDIDSVSFTESVSDAAGNQAGAQFVTIAPLPWENALSLIASAQLEQNPIKAKPFLPFQPATSLVLLGRDGPLTPTALNRRMAEAGGPVLSIRTRNPLDRIQVQVYSNLGVFLDAAEYVLSPEEWDKLRAEAAAGTAGGDTVTARIMWYPASRGAKLGTGVYVLKASILTRPVWSQEPDGRWRQRAPTRRPLGPWLFGFLRQ